MKTSWYKSFRDIGQNKTRSILAVLAIAIGVSGFGAVLSAYAILTRELNAGYLETNPASATVWTDRIEESLSAELKTLPEISDVEARRSISARIRVHGGDWKSAVLFIIEDFENIRISKLKPQKGKWPPQDGEILIERDALSVARAKIGDSLLTKTPQGREQALKLTGTVHDAGQAQARMEQLVYGYINRNTLKFLGEEPYLDQWKIIVRGDAGSEQHVRRSVARIKSWIQSKGKQIKQTEVPQPGKHPHADLMGMLLLFKAGFGLFALLLSGVLIFNLISALMAGQVRQIGVMKTIGASRNQIVALYLTSVFSLATLALTLSFPISIISGRALSAFMSVFLNFDLKNVGTPFWVFALMAATGWTIPLIAAFLPIRKGSRITPREAINDYGIQEAKFGRAAGDSVLLKIGGLARPFLLSLRNTFRRRGRLILIIATLTAGGTIFIAAWDVRASLIRTVDVMLSSFRYDVSLNFAELYPIAGIESAIRSVPDVQHVESLTIVEGDLTNKNDHRIDSITIAAPPAASRTIALHLIEGRMFSEQEQNVMVINTALERRGFKTGEIVEIQINNQSSPWKIIGVARQPLAGPTAYAPAFYLAQISDQVGKTKSIRIITTEKNTIAIQETQRKLEKALAAAGFETTSNVSMADRRLVIDSHNSVIYIFLIVMALLIVVVGGLGLMTVMSIGVLERRREIGVLRAIGATRNKILFIILTEGALIGLMSWILAIPLSAMISNPLGNLAAGRILRTHLEFAMDPTGVLLWLLIVILFGALASYIPARNASRQTVRELVEYE